MGNSNHSAELVVLGGGLCGLYGALEAQKRGIKVKVFEKENRMGGLASGHKLGENWYDLGVHMLHAFDQEVFESCKQVLSGERIEVPLKAHIQWMGKRYHYPLRGRDILLGLPPFELIKCVSGLFLAELKNRFGNVVQGEDAESALIEMYGNPLYEFFFKEFTHRYWGIHPRELSAEFVRRKMPRLSAVDVFKNALSWLRIAKPKDEKEGALRFETLHYSKTGIEALPRLLAKDLIGSGAEVVGDSPVQAVYHTGGKVTGVRVNGERKCSEDDQYLSTVPITELVKMFSPSPPSEVIAAAASLRYKPMVVYALLVKKERCMKALYTYYRDTIFHRVGEPKNAGVEIRPSGCTSLIVEMTCEEGDEKWNGDMYVEVIKDLEKEGLCRATDVIEKHLIRSHYAYPIFKKGFDTHLKLLQDYLAEFSNLKSVGRQGSFSYPNMHQAMRMGIDGIDDLYQV